jgi:hypothetical protein
MADRGMRIAVAYGAVAVLMAVVAIAWVAAGGRSVTPGPPVGAASPPIVAPPGAALLVGAGDISSCGNDHDELTARLVESFGDVPVFTTGDNAYERGSAAEFATCYDPTWGRFRARTHPIPGNHEYVTPGAGPYFAYFGASAGQAGRSWYGWDLNGWRIEMLDSNCEFAGGCDDGSPQLQWLKQDLAAHPARCTLAMWHHPRFSSGRHGDSTAVQPFWSTLAAAGADLILVGHDHSDERFAPLDVAGRRDAVNGMRQIVVGTGGKDLYEFVELHATSEAHASSTFGVLAVTLWPDRYEWHFLPSEGPFTDQGTGVCH